MRYNIALTILLLITGCSVSPTDVEPNQLVRSDITNSLDLIGSWLLIQTDGSVNPTSGVDCVVYEFQNDGAARIVGMENYPPFSNMTYAVSNSVLIMSGPNNKGDKAKVWFEDHHLYMEVQPNGRPLCKLKRID